MGWVYLDDQFPDHPKVVAAGGDASWMFVCSLAYARRYNTGGAIPAGQVSKLTDRRSPLKLADTLVKVGLWERAEHGFQIHDYSDWNRSSESRSEAGRKGAEARWHGNANGNGRRNGNAPPGQMAQDAQFPLPIPDSSSPPPTHAGGDRVEDEDEIFQALNLLAQRAMVARPPRSKPIADPGAWIRRAVAERRTRHAAAIGVLPEGLSAVEIAALLEPEGGQPAETDEDRQARANAENRRLADLPHCDDCNDSGWLDEDPARGKCRACGRLLSPSERAEMARQ